MNRNNILNSPFDINIHKVHFINYLEVVILEDGKVEYAVPSHQEKLIKLAMNKLQVTRKELEDLCPQEFYADFTVWLSSISKAVPVWNEFYDGTPNEKQLETLKLLQQEGLYTGKIKH